MGKPVIYIHLAVSIWVYGTDTVILSHPLNTKVPKAFHSEIGELFIETAVNYSTFPSFLALVVLIAFDVITNILTTFKLTQCAAGIVKRLLLCFCPCFCRKCIKTGNAVHIQEDIELFTEEIVHNNRKFDSYLVSFQIFVQKDWITSSPPSRQEPQLLLQRCFPPRELPQSQEKSRPRPRPRSPPPWQPPRRPQRPPPRTAPRWQLPPPQPPPERLELRCRPWLGLVFEEI